MADNIFSTLYSKLCAKHKVEKQDFVAESWHPDGSINLSNRSVSVETFAVIGKILETTTIISKINLEGCMVDEAGLKPLFIGLAHNRSVAYVNLKGNSIQNNAVAELANLLASNSFITSLFLEWNNLGLCLHSFSKICEALKTNQSLIHLDLKSNQLDSVAASYLAKVISCNSTLRHLDLGFNNFGNDGGKLLLDGVRNNSTLMKLDLVCNNIFVDVLNEIEAQMFRIREVSLERENYCNQNDQLKLSLRESEERFSKYIRDLEKEVLEKQTDLSRITRETQSSIHSLKDELNLKSNSLDSLQSRFNIALNLLESEKSYGSEMATKCQHLDRELQNLRDTHDLFTKQSKEKEMNCSQIYQREKESLQSAVSKYEVQVLDLESKYKNSKSEVFSMKEMIITLEAQLKATKCESEDICANEKSEHKDAIRKLERSHSAQIKKLQTQVDGKKTELQTQTSQMNVQIEELEKDLRIVKNQSELEKETQLSKISALKTQNKYEQALLKRSSEGKLRDLDDQLNVQRDSVSSLMTTNAKLESKVLSLTNELSSLQNELDGKQSVMKITESRIRNEFKSQTEELQIMKEEKVASQEKLLQLQRGHDSEQRRLETSIRKISEETNVLQEKFNEKEKEILRMKQEESRKIGAFQSAFMQYLQTPTS